MMPHPSILVLDDDPSILEFLTEALTSEYAVYTAADPLIAIDLIVKQHIDLLLVDLLMPVVDGVEFIHRIRSYRDFDHIPILVMSAHPHFIDMVTGVRVEAILPKPFALENLLRVAAEAIGSINRDSRSEVAPLP